jgi:hypothetical protein
MTRAKKIDAFFASDDGDYQPGRAGRPLRVQPNDTVNVAWERLQHRNPTLHNMIDDISDMPSTSRRRLEASLAFSEVVQDLVAATPVGQ